MNFLAKYSRVYAVIAVSCLLVPVIATTAQSQEVRITPSKNNADPGETIIFTVLLTTTGTTPVFGVETMIDFGPGFELVGTVETAIAINSRWLTGIKQIDGGVVDIAVTAGGSATPCSDECILATIRGRYSSEGRKTIRFIEENVSAREPQNLGLVLLSATNLSVQVGVAAFPGDFDGDGVVSFTEVTRTIQAYFGGVTLEPGELATFGLQPGARPGFMDVTRAIQSYFNR